FVAREYVVTGSNISFANQAVTLVWIAPPSNASIEILRCWVGQAANATSVQQRVQLVTQVSSFPTMGSALAPQKLKQSDPASLLSSLTSGLSGTGINATGEGTGTKTALVNDAFNVLTGWLWVPTPPETIVLTAPQSAGFCLHFPSAPATL